VACRQWLLMSYFDLLFTVKGVVMKAWMIAIAKFAAFVVLLTAWAMLNYMNGM